MNFIIQLVVGVVLSLASTLLQQAFAPKTETQTGTRGSAQIGGKVPQYFLIGTVGEAGKHEYRNTWGHDGDVPNAYNVDVYSFGDLPITALAKLFVFGVEEPVADTGHVLQGYPTTGDKAGKLWVEFYDGSQVSVSTYLSGKFSGDVDRPWLSDMIGRGVPYLTVTALWDEKLWTRFPEIVGEFQGIPLYDPRQDDTAGGAGEMRWDYPSTWAFSDNNAVMIYNIERGIYYGGAKVWGGSATAAQLPYDVWAAAMDACDEEIALVAGGTEKRFRAGRRVNLNETPADVIQELLIGCNGRISHASDGTVYILVGVPDEADGGFTDADVLATEKLGSIPFPNLDDIVNGATATYREPAQAWEDKETAPYYRADLEEEDDGRQQLQGLDLGTTFSGTQAQRILKAVIEEGRRFGSHVVGLPPEFARFRPLNVLTWTSERFGYVEKKFLVTARTRDPWGNVIFGLQEIDPADHNWSPEDDEQPLSFAPVVVNRPAPQPITGFAVEPFTGDDPDGNPRRPGFRIFGYGAGLVDVQAVWVQARLAGDTGLVIDGRAPYDPAEVSPSASWSGDPLLPNVAYQVRGRLVPFSGRETEWSGWLNVTTPDVRLTALDIDIQLDEIAAEITGKLDWVGAGVRSALEQFRRLGTLVAESDLDNFNQREVLERRIGVQLDGLQASFAEVIEVALGPGGAIATALSSLYAAMGGSSSEVNVRWEAMATDDGVSAKYGVALRTALDGGAEFRTATFYGEVPEDPDEPTRWVFAGGQIILATDSGGTLKTALLAEDGEIKFVGARAGRISSADGTSMYVDFDDPEIFMQG